MASRPQQHGALRRALGAAWDWALGKKLVGKDAMGNSYFRWHEGYGESRTERREVQWSRAYMYYDPKDIPSEWRMWLRKLREEPPTDAEMAQNAAKQAQYLARVAAVEEAERLRRLRQATVGTPDQHAGAQPDMARFLQQMGQPRAGGGEAAGEAAAAEPGAATEPEGASGLGSGIGDSYKPGTWRPGS